MKKVRIGMIGAGNIANVHLTNYMLLDDVEIAAICDINPERLKETAEKFGIKDTYTSVEEMLKDAKLDAADVCVWNCNHAKCTIAALEAGLHVMCEKPMAYNTGEAVKMKQAADKAGKVLMIGFCMRFSDQDRVVRDFIDKGYVGDIYYSKATYVRRHGNPGGWFCDKSRSGGGPVIDLGVHVIDHTRYLMGNPKPVSVYAVTADKMGNRSGLKTDVGWKPKDATDHDICDVEDFATALIRYDNGSVTFLETSYSINGEPHSDEELFGTKGGFKLNEQETLLYTELNGYMVDVTPKLENLKNSKNEYLAEMEHFVKCVKGDTQCIARAEDGIEIMKILDAIYESAKTGHEVIIK